MQASPRSSEIYLPKGNPPRPGQVLIQKELGQTLASLSEEGMETFYRGRIAEKIVSASREAGGLLEPDDLAGYEPQWQKPLSSSYRGVPLHTAPFPGMGIQVLETLKILERFDLAAYGRIRATTGTFWLRQLSSPSAIGFAPSRVVRQRRSDSFLRNISMKLPAGLMRIERQRVEAIGSTPPFQPRPRRSARGTLPISA